MCKQLLLSVLVATLAACAATEPAGVNEEGLTRIAQQLQAQGDDAGAANFYQRALQRKPDDVTAMRNLGAILEAHGNLVEAETYDAKAMQLAPRDVDLKYAEARVLVRLNRIPEARDVYWGILEQNEADVKALNGLGITLDYLGQHEEAQKSYRSALEQEPENLAALNNLAHSYVLSGQYDKAIALLEPHANDKAATPALRQNLAEAYGLNGMVADAARMARMDLNPQDVKRNLAYYRKQRAALSPEPKFAADLGAYPTSAMAEAKAESIRALAANESVTVAVKPDVQTMGGTPSFAVRGFGFANSGALNKFCDLLVKNGMGCKPLKN